LRRSAAAILRRGLEAADPQRLVENSLRLSGRNLVAAGARYPLGRGRLVLLAVGKAAGPMARAAEMVLGRRLTAGLVVSSVPPPRPLRFSRFLEAGHPMPDRRGEAAARDVEALVGPLGREDTLLVLLSGGASALLPAPSPGLRLADKAKVTSLLLRAGADIHELNTVRKHLSRLKGGGLAGQAAPARVVTLVLSDVVGDDLSTIASGPTVPDPTTFAEARAVIGRHGLWTKLPAAVRRHLDEGARGTRPETPKPRARAFARAASHVVGSNARSVDAAAREARRLGYRTVVLTTRLEGEAREAARVLVAVLRESCETGRPARPPVCLIAGGETTVTVTGRGHGGRNQELATAAALALHGFPMPAAVASLATDGVDGRSDAAGGIVDDTTVDRARALGLAPAAAFLAENDTRSFLGPLGDLILTGPTGTNVVDLVVLLAGMPRR
jgi:hydroxypyruvate reductase